jgi:hypothetical protein
MTNLLGGITDPAYNGLSLPCHIINERKSTWLKSGWIKDWKEGI